MQGDRQLHHAKARAEVAASHCGGCDDRGANLLSDLIKLGAREPLQALRALKAREERVGADRAQRNPFVHPWLSY